MGPYDYSIDIQSPVDSALKGFQGGLAMRQGLVDEQLKEQKLTQQLAMQKDIAGLTANPNAGAHDYAAMMTKYPQLSEQFKRSWDVLNADQQKNSLSHATQVYAAVNSGQHDVAINMLRKQAEAARAAGDEKNAKINEDMASLIEAHPDTAKTTGGLMLAAVMGPEKFADTFGKLGAEQRAQDQAPADLRKANADASSAEADAQTKGVTAKYAESAAVQDLAKKGWDIKAVQADIDYKRESSRISAMNAAISREGNDLKRQELQLKVQEARQKLDDGIREKAASAESAAATIDNSLNTIERIKKNKSLNDVLGPMEGRLPAVLSDDASDAIALIDTLGSQAFLSQVGQMKGQGALSNAEGEKLQSALTNLSRKQSESQFRANLDDAARIMKKARENLARRSGVPLGKPDTPAAPGARPPLDSFFKQ